MAPNVPALAGKAREVIAKVRPGPMEGRRALPIRSDEVELRRLWADADARTAVLAGIPVADAAIEVGDEDRDWGRVVHLTLWLEAPVPGMAAQALAGKALRRLKALAEAGEVPTTAFNPAARDDAGEATA